MPLKKRWKCAEPAYAERLRAARSQCERRKGEIEDVVAVKPQKQYPMSVQSAQKRGYVAFTLPKSAPSLP
ncbi:MAG TPA: hypothetical protein VFH31_19680 [Pyrinomonadaceae bacterium]|nr:hypothetical protein [Pyrinomonadaceae bacterium]